MRQTDLAAALDIEGPSLVRLLDALQRQKLLERAEDPGDRRSKHLRMTAAGRVVCARVTETHAALSAGLLEDVSADDNAACLRAFDAIEHAIRRRSQPRGGEA